MNKLKYSVPKRGQFSVSERSLRNYSVRGSSSQNTIGGKKVNHHAGIRLSSRRLATKYCSQTKSTSFLNRNIPSSQLLRSFRNGYSSGSSDGEMSDQEVSYYYGNPLQVMNFELKSSQISRQYIEECSVEDLLEKLSVAQRILNPVLDEIIAATSFFSPSEMRLFAWANCPICSLSTQQYLDAMRASKLLQEVNSELFKERKRQIPTKKGDIMHFPKEMIVNMLCVLEQTPEEPNGRIYINKELMLQLIHLFEILENLISKLTYSTDFTCSPCEERQSSSTTNTNKLAKAMQTCSSSNSSQIPSVKSMSKNIYCASLDVRIKRDISSFCEAKKVVIDCLMELCDVKSNTKRATKKIEQGIFFEDVNSGDGCKMLDVSHLHVNLNGIAMVLKLNPKVVESIIATSFAQNSCDECEIKSYQEFEPVAKKSSSKTASLTDCCSAQHRMTYLEDSNTTQKSSSSSKVAGSSTTTTNKWKICCRRCCKKDCRKSDKPKKIEKKKPEKRKRCFCSCIRRKASPSDMSITPSDILPKQKKSKFSDSTSVQTSKTKACTCKKCYCKCPKLITKQTQYTPSVTPKVCLSKGSVAFHDSKMVSTEPESFLREKFKCCPIDRQSEMTQKYPTEESIAVNYNQKAITKKESLREKIKCCQINLPSETELPSDVVIKMEGAESSVEGELKVSKSVEDSIISFVEEYGPVFACKEPSIIGTHPSYASNLDVDPNVSVCCNKTDVSVQTTALSTLSFPENYVKCPNICEEMRKIIADVRRRLNGAPLALSSCGETLRTISPSRETNEEEEIFNKTFGICQPLEVCESNQQSSESNYIIEEIESFELSHIPSLGQYSTPTSHCETTCNKKESQPCSRTEFIAALMKRNVEIQVTPKKSKEGSNHSSGKQRRKISDTNNEATTKIKSKPSRHRVSFSEQANPLSADLGSKLEVPAENVPKSSTVKRRGCACHGTLTKTCRCAAKTDPESLTDSNAGYRTASQKQASLLDTNSSKSKPGNQQPRCPCKGTKACKRNINRPKSRDTYSVYQSECWEGPYTVSNVSMPKMIPSKDKNDVKTRRPTINHPDSKVREKLEQIGYENIITASKPAKCCRKSMLNEVSQTNLPYPASLQSLPLDEDDIDVIVKTLQEAVSEKSKKCFQCCRAKLEYYTNLVKDDFNEKSVNFPTSSPVYEVMYFEIERKKNEEDKNSKEASMNFTVTVDPNTSSNLTDADKQYYGLNQAGQSSLSKKESKKVNENFNFEAEQFCSSWIPFVASETSLPGEIISSTRPENTIHHTPHSISQVYVSNEIPQKESFRTAADDETSLSPQHFAESLQRRNVAHMGSANTNGNPTSSPNEDKPVLLELIQTDVKKYGLSLSDLDLVYNIRRKENAETDKIKIPYNKNPFDNLANYESMHNVREEPSSQSERSLSMYDNSLTDSTTSATTSSVNQDCNLHKQKKEVSKNPKIVASGKCCSEDAALPVTKLYDKKYLSHGSKPNYKLQEIILEEDTEDLRSSKMSIPSSSTMDSVNAFSSLTSSTNSTSIDNAFKRTEKNIISPNALYSGLTEDSMSHLHAKKNIRQNIIPEINSDFLLYEDVEYGYTEGLSQPNVEAGMSRHRSIHINKRTLTRKPHREVSFEKEMYSVQLGNMSSMNYSKGHTQRESIPQDSDHYRGATSKLQITYSTSKQVENSLDAKFDKNRKINVDNTKNLSEEFTAATITSKQKHSSRTPSRIPVSTDCRIKASHSKDNDPQRRTNAEVAATRNRSTSSDKTHIEIKISPNVHGDVKCLKSQKIADTDLKMFQKQDEIIIPTKNKNSSTCAVRRSNLTRSPVGIRTTVKKCLDHSTSKSSESQTVENKIENIVSSNENENVDRKDILRQRCYSPETSSRLIPEPKEILVQNVEIVTNKLKSKRKNHKLKELLATHKDAFNQCNLDTIDSTISCFVQNLLKNCERASKPSTNDIGVATKLFASQKSANSCSKATQTAYFADVKRSIANLKKKLIELYKNAQNDDSSKSLLISDGIQLQKEPNSVSVRNLTVEQPFAANKKSEESYEHDSLSDTSFKASTSHCKLKLTENLLFPRKIISNSKLKSMQSRDSILDNILNEINCRLNSKPEETVNYKFLENKSDVNGSSNVFEAKQDVVCMITLPIKFDSSKGLKALCKECGCWKKPPPSETQVTLNKQTNTDESYEPTNNTREPTNNSSEPTEDACCTCDLSKLCGCSQLSLNKQPYPKTNRQTQDDVGSNLPFIPCKCEDGVPNNTPKPDASYLPEVRSYSPDEYTEDSINASLTALKSSFHVVTPEDNENFDTPLKEEPQLSDYDPQASVITEKFSIQSPSNESQATEPASYLSPRGGSLNEQPLKGSQFQADNSGSHSNGSFSLVSGSSYGPLREAVDRRSSVKEEDSSTPNVSPKLKQVNKLEVEDPQICWALTQVKIFADGTREFEVLEVSPVPPGHYIIPDVNNVILLGPQPTHT